MLLLCTQWLLMHLLYFSSLVVIISSEKGPRPKFSFVCPWHFSLSNQVFIVDILLQEYWLSTHLVKYPLFYDGLQVTYQQFFLLLEKLLMIEIPLCKGNKMQAVFQIFFFWFRIILKEVTWNCIMQISSYHGSRKTAWGTDLPKIASLLLTFVYS